MQMSVNLLCFPVNLLAQELKLQDCYFVGGKVDEEESVDLS